MPLYIPPLCAPSLPPTHTHPTPAGRCLYTVIKDSKDNSWHQIGCSSATRPTDVVSLRLHTDRQRWCGGLRSDYLAPPPLGGCACCPCPGGGACCLRLGGGAGCALLVRPWLHVMRAQGANV